MKSIFLPPKHFALVDDEDYEAVKAIGNWSYSSGYACHWYTDASGKRRRLWLHRFICERILGHVIPMGMEVDHVQGAQLGKKARLDARRNSLRLSTKNQNQANKGPQINTQISKGISLRANRYEVRIRHYGQRLYLGRYHTLYTALTVYGFAHRLIWGEFTTEALVPEPTPELQAYVLSRLMGQGVEVAVM
jgi:hypothetical protein